ncbi:hypothetical protein H4Q26_008467 [Puccinia striiformis f. sp. tritici PST-130]|nr:hypothetical protein H4Q26_008467 [Puccinia striiformis f. sp. tritici PST-130]
MDKRSKREEALSVGLETSKPWNGTSSTLDTAWSKILSDANKEASDHTNLAESLSNEVCEVLKTCEKKKEATRKRHVEFGVKLLAERDKIYHDRAKAKQRYDDACSLVESTRVKQGQAKDDKHLEKAAKNMDVHTNEILSAKNAYLLSISVANEVKRRFYHVDLPSLEDDSQSIWSLTASELVSLLKTVSQLNGKYLESLRSNNTINGQTNQSLFIEYNRRPFTDRPDFIFEPCPIWHDSAEYALTSPEPKVLLQNRLGQARSKASELEPTIEAKRHEITGLENLREAYSSNESLGDPDEVVENLLESVRQTISLELQYTVLTKEVEVLEQTLGDDQGSQRPHTFESASFVTPTTCCLCNSNIWGFAKQGVTCKACSISAHVKCGPKVPSNCAGSAPLTGLKRNVSIAATFPPAARLQGIDTIPNQGGLTRAVSTSNRPPAVQTHGLGVGGAGGVSRSATTANRSVALPVNRNPLNRSQARPQARMIYGYEASSGFEVSASAEPILTRPHLPRSASAIEPFLSSPSPGLQHRLTSSADHHHPRSSLPASERLTSVTRPPFLLRHHRTKSAEPSLAFISPLSKVISRHDSQSAQALLQRALEEDEDARSWVDDDDDYDLLDQDTLDVEIDNHPHDQLSHRPPTIIINQIPLSPGCRMDPVLADLEAESRLNVQTECAICLKKGINYPKCPKCQLEFCSRTCRVSMGDGDRHECS